MKKLVLFGVMLFLMCSVSLAQSGDNFVRKEILTAEDVESLVRREVYYKGPDSGPQRQLAKIYGINITDGIARVFCQIEDKRKPSADGEYSLRTFTFIKLTDGRWLYDFDGDPEYLTKD